MKGWKISFFIAAFLLLVTNIFWLYIVIDEAVTKMYREQTCGEYEDDVKLFRGLIKLDYDKNKIIRSLGEVSEDNYLLQKGDEEFLLLNSFEVYFNEDSTISKTRAWSEPE